MDNLPLLQQVQQIEQQRNDVVGIHKQDIDDNCPMTGDETDTESNIVFFDKELNTNVLSDADSKTEYLDVETKVKIQSEESPRKRTENVKTEEAEDLFPLFFVVDDEESFSSDFNCVSDDDTSSIAGSFDDFGKDDEDSLSEPQSEQSREDKLRRLALRRHLDQLGELVVVKECEVQQARDVLQNCRDHLKALENDMASANEQMIEAKANGKMGLYYRLKSKHEKLTTEVEIERKVEAASGQRLEEAEFFLAQTYIEHAKFLPLDEELEADEEQNTKMKSEIASLRIKKELNTAINIDRRKKNRDKEHLSAVREKERRNRQTLISAKKNREVATKYLKETMSRVRQRESEEEERSRHDLSQRMSALLGLKKNIEVNKENIKAVQARHQHLHTKELTKETQERDRLIAMGENPDEIMTRRKRIRQFERDKVAFERKQREREIEIVNKVMSEDKQMKRRHQQQPQLWADNRPRRIPRRRSKPRFAPSSGSESMEYGADVEDTGGKISYLSKVSTDEEGEFSPYGATNRDDDKSDTTEDDDLSKDRDDLKKSQHRVVEEEDEEEEEEEEEEDDDQYDRDHNDETLVQPEFKGLWETDEIQDHSKNSGKWKGANQEYSKYEQEMMKNALQKQKQNIIQKQVVVGREFKGAAFYSKPKEVVFKDFNVGETYKEKVLLTNVSYTQNYCQFVGITEQLKDFIDIAFTPSGTLSAGLTCDLTVTFKPMINVDLEGHIEMMAQTGLFYIPIKCLIKKCQVSVDTDKVDFNNVVVGETRKKIITIKNDGALQATFTFYQKQEPKLVEAEASRKLDENNTNTDMTESIESSNNIVAEEMMRVGKITSGTIDPFSSMLVDIIFSPTAPKVMESTFIISFDTSKLIEVKAKGVAVNVPVWVERKVIDLKICMYDRLYQDSILVSNSSTTALRLRFEIPKEARDHLEILPKTAYIQAESQFSAQLKFLPRQTLFDDAPSYLDKNAGILTVPITIRVADQTQPVEFIVCSTVTSSDLEFDRKEINFGYCTVYESVFQTIKLFNKSVLPQQYGFVGTPEEIDVQPNDGFGTILPNESLDIDVAFFPAKAQDYKFILTCKSQIGREFTIRCKAVGILPPLKLSESLIKFKATAIDDTSSTHLFIINDHTSTNEFTHPVPRIGSGEIFPVGPTSYQFMIPEGAPITVSPLIGTVQPGQKNIIHVTFAPKLDPSAVEQMAKKLSDEDKLSYGLEEKEAGKRNRKISKINKASKNNVPQSPAKKTNAEKPCSYDFYVKKARLALLRDFEKSFSTYILSCFMAYGECGEPGTLVYDPNYAIRLEVRCPTVRPSLIAVSETGDSVVDFGKVSMGQRHTQIISIQNISNSTCSLKSTLLDPHGPFELVNALRDIQPRGVRSIRLAFTPQNDDEFYEVLGISSATQTVHICLKGKGIKPRLNMEPQKETFDVGDALVMDTVVSSFKLTNTSELSLQFATNLGSLLSSKHTRTQSLPVYLKQSEDLLEHDESFAIGPGNKSGLAVFGCNPSVGTLSPGESVDLQVSFSPDHPSELYRDELFVNVNTVDEFLQVHLIGRAWPTSIYVRGWDRLTPVEENLACLNQCTYKEEKTEKNVSLTFRSLSKSSKCPPAERSLIIGCIKSALQTKKSCDFSFENYKDALDKGFTIDPMKGGVDIGVQKNIVLKWNPSPTYDPQNIMKTSVTLVVRGDGNLTYKIALLCSVVSDVGNSEEVLNV